MSVLSRLICKEWFRSYFGAFFTLLIIISVANLLNGLLRDSVTFKSVFFNHLVELPTYLLMIQPISCLVASIFSLTKLKNRNELTAIFASGYSINKFFLNISLCAAVVGLCQFNTGAFLRPFLKKNRFLIVTEIEKFKNMKGDGLASSVGGGKIWFKGKNFFFSFSSFQRKNNTLNDVTLYYYINSSLIEKVIHLPFIKYEHESLWSIPSSVLFSDLDKKVFSFTKSLDQKFINLEQTPEDFKQIEADITTLPLPKLQRYVNHLHSSGINAQEYEIIIFDLYSTSLVCILFALLASVSAFNPNRRSSTLGKNLFFIFAFTVIYWLLYSYLLELGKNSKISSLMACLTVPALLSLLLVFYYNKHRKLAN